MSAPEPAVASDLRTVAWFTDPECRDPALAGGKGVNLGRLAGEGFDVPPGFVVTTAAYDAHVEPFRDELRRDVDGLPVDDHRRMEAAVAAIRERIETAEMPGAVAAGIREAYESLGGGYVAVRSSGTAEDLEGAAFAGLHDTYLDIRGEDELLDAVRRDWASVWTARAVAYRRNRGFLEMPSIAVVVQRMLEPEVAGVLFTANPVSRNTRELLINANWGLGESVVQGTTAPDEFTVEHGTFAVVRSVCGEKTIEVVRNAGTGRGVHEREVPADRREVLTLREGQVSDLGRLGAAIQAHYDDSPQDIEWAWAEERFWLLQARPITGVEFDTDAPVPDPDLENSPVHRPGRTARWTTANVDENMPGTLTPLTWSMYFPATETTMRDCWVDLGVFRESDRPVPDDVDGRFISVAYGHAIANVDLLAGLAARMPGGSGDQMEEQLFGSVQGGGPPPPTGLAKVERWPVVAVKLPWTLRRAIRALDPLASRSDAYWRRTAFSLGEATAHEALAALVEARDRYEEVVAVHMVLAIASQAVLGQVESLAARASLPGLERELIRSEHGTAEFHLVRDLWRLAREEITVEQFVRAHGYHGPREGLMDAVVWREDPQSVLALARAYAERDDGGDIDATATRQQGKQVEAMRRLTEALPRPLHAPARMLVRFAARVPDWRETGRACILQAIDAGRAASRQLGDRLCEAGAIDARDDVQFLTIDELVGDRRDTFRDLVEARKRDHAAFETITLPHVWHGAPEPTTGATAGNEDALSTVEGLGVSAGVVEGTVRVVRDLGEADIAEGTVMVCHATDPSWASLFPLASAVVTDVGSALSHAAIVCRELGLPCVANTRTGTRDLRDGMRVRVDGSAGVVAVIEDEGR